MPYYNSTIYLKRQFNSWLGNKTQFFNWHKKYQRELYFFQIFTIPIFMSILDLYLDSNEKRFPYAYYGIYGNNHHFF